MLPKEPRAIFLTTAQVSRSFVDQWKHNLLIGYNRSCQVGPMAWPL